ncbi:MAG: hypothetical protein K2L88_05555, partial [Clostridiales bacterium]|nr:hypothetical protein [Clostridiales bacterium]
MEESVELSAVKYGSVCTLSQYDDAMFDFETAKRTLSGFLDEKELKALCKTPACVCAEGALVAYVRHNQFRNDINIGSAESYESSAYMDIDANTAKTLELVESQSRKRGTTLRDVINKTCTPMGDRQLQKWLLRPLYGKAEIDRRLCAVDALFSDTILRERLRAALLQIKDIVRISANLSLGEIKPKDVTALNVSFHALPEVKAALDAVTAPMLCDINNQIMLLSELTNMIDDSIVVPSQSDKKEETYIIKSGYDAALDEYRSLVSNSRKIIAQMEAEEREKTQIKNLRISYNRLFGYFIEVPRQYDSMVPSYYQRRQTVVNAERYITDELKDLEYKVLNASDLAEKREKELYAAVLNK